MARYLLSLATRRALPGSFPWATLVVNGVACFTIGLLWALTEEKLKMGDEMRAFVFIGFLGAFSTYSTFALETGQLVRASDWNGAILNVAAQLVLGFVLLFAGNAVGRLF